MKYLYFITLIVFFNNSIAQIKNIAELNSQTNSKPKVTIDALCSFNHAIEIIKPVIENFEKHSLVSEFSSDKSMGISLIDYPYDNALSAIINHLNLDLIYRDSLYIVMPKTELPDKENRENIFSQKQIKVDAVLFEANTEMMRQRGINWQAMISKSGMIIGSDMKSFESTVDNSVIPNYTFNVQLEGDIGIFSGYTNALLQFFENENMGEVVSTMSVTVRDGKAGKMQVGSDFSIKQKDFAGNTTDAFYPTGTIINIIPQIFTKDTLNFALLNLNVERSFAMPNELSTEVKKTSTSSEIIMTNDEEAIVGGLLYTHYAIERGGVPVLKDLPGWVLGLRYLTGYDKIEAVEREVFLILKINIIPSLAERFDI